MGIIYTSFQRNFMRKIKSSCVADLGRSIKAKKIFLKKLTNVHGMNNNGNPLKSLQENVVHFYNALVYAVTGGDGTYATGSEELKFDFFGKDNKSNKNKKDYTVNAFFLGNIVENCIKKHNQQIDFEVWMELSKELADGINKVINSKDKTKGKEKDQKELEKKDKKARIKIPDFMADIIIKSKLKKVRDIFKDYEGALSEVEKEEMEKLKKELGELSIKLQNADLCFGDNDDECKKELKKAFAIMQTITFKKKKNLEEENIFNCDKYFMPSDMNDSIFNFMGPVAYPIRNAVKIYKGMDINDENCPLCLSCIIDIIGYLPLVVAENFLKKLK